MYLSKCCVICLASAYLSVCIFHYMILSIVVQVRVSVSLAIVAIMFMYVLFKADRKENFSLIYLYIGIAVM